MTLKQRGIAMYRVSRNMLGVHVVAVMVAALALTACADRTPTAVDSSAGSLLSSLQVAPHALTLAVNDSMQLTASAYNLAGTAIPDPGTITYTSLSPSKVTVSPNGTVKAVEAASGTIGVIATLQQDRYTVADTIQVLVTTNRETPAQFVMEPDPYDGTEIGVGYTTDITTYVVTTSGDTLWDVPVTFSTNNSKASVNPMYDSFSSHAFGNVTVYANTTVYGITYMDSITYRITYATEAYFVWSSYSNSWSYPPALQVVVRPGAIISWSNYGSTLSPVVTFDDPSAASGVDGGPSGNIPAFSGTRADRQFNTPGTYAWHSGTQTGTVIVTSTDMPSGTN